jgi:HEPN domain-containing protein
MPHDPGDIFVVAEQFRNGSKLLNLGQSGFPFDVRMAMMSCAAFALELYLKCLIAMETGKAPPAMHDLQKLFDRLHVSTQTKIRRYFDDNSSLVKEFVEAQIAKHGVKAPIVDFDYVLTASREAFQLARYIYEGGFPAEKGWIADVIMDGARRTILDRFPDWREAKQVSPAVILHRPPIPEPP